MNKAEPFHLDGVIRSDMLRVLRQYKVLSPLFYGIAQFNLVVDTNIILCDLIWLVKRRNPNAITDLMESIKAGIIIAYIPSSVLREVKERIPTVAKLRGLCENSLNSEWKNYRKLLKVRTPRKALIEKHTNPRDPDDAPILALAEMIKATGIHSKDEDINAMGGLVIEFSVLKDTRRYARQLAISVSIESAGIFAVRITATALIDLAKAINDLIRKIPTPILIFIFLSALYVLSNKKLRNNLVDCLAPISQLGEYWPEIRDALLRLGATVSDNHVPHPHITYRQKNTS